MPWDLVVIPVSSLTSLIAAVSMSSPGSAWPPGNFQLPIPKRSFIKRLDANFIKFRWLFYSNYIPLLNWNPKSISLICLSQNKFSCSFFSQCSRSTHRFRCRPYCRNFLKSHIASKSTLKIVSNAVLNHEDFPIIHHKTPDSWRRRLNKMHMSAIPNYFGPSRFKTGRLDHQSGEPGLFDSNHF